MALALAMGTDFGAPATYHTIALVTLDRLGHTGTLTLSGYADETARRTGKSPLVSTMLSFASLAGDPLPAPSALYALVKADPRFAGAVDC